MTALVSHNYGWKRMRVGIGIGIALLSAAPAMAQFVRVGIGVGNAAPNGQVTSQPIVSADGRYVAFGSAASNLVAGDTNNTADVFIRDLQMSATTRVSVASAGTEIPVLSVLKAFSGNGRAIVFSTDANLAGTDTNLCEFGNRHCHDIYVRDLDANTTTRIGKVVGTQPDYDTENVSISADGRFIVFTTAGGLSQIYLHDRNSGTTTAIGPDFPGRDDSYFGGLISGDGHTILFMGAAPPDATLPPVEQCPSPICSTAVYVYTRDTGTYTTILPDPATFHLEKLEVPAGGQLGLDLFSYSDISADGRYVLLSQSVKNLLDPNPQQPYVRALIYDRQTGNTDFKPFTKDRVLDGMSRDGRYLVWLEGAPAVRQTVVFEDRVSGLRDPLDNYTPFRQGYQQFFLSQDARVLTFATLDKVIAEDTDDASDIYAFDRDPDKDGLPSRWETTFGLDPAVAGDAAGDADSDGITNLQEYQQGTHPKGSHTRYFAEGAANSFFTTRFALVNPNDAAANVVLHYLGSTGATASSLRTLPAKSRTTIDFQFFGPVGESDFSTVVESDALVVADRTMTWDATGYGSHAETSIAAPAMTWYLAEGATHGAFDLFYLLQNPGSVDANVSIEYLRPAPALPVTKVYVVPAHSRTTIYVDQQGPDLAETDVAAKITSSQPVIVERAMYATRAGQPFAAGHDGAGVTAPATRWFLAEGATGQFFDEYVLVGNPGTDAAELSVSYLLPDGQKFSKPYTVDPRSRLTIGVDGEDARLADTPVSIIVESTNTVPVVVERAMWWPSPNWYEAHLSAGSTETGTRWALADGQVGHDDVTNGTVETYILIANTSATAGTATVTLLIEGGGQVSTQVQLQANSRINVTASELFPANTVSRFGAIVESNGPEIVVERAMYTSTGGLPWTSGTDALATKLPVVP